MNTQTPTTTYTHRVVVVYSDKPGFYGASGAYATKAEAVAQMVEIARTWIDLATPELTVEGSFVIRHPKRKRTVTYSILSEVAALASP